MSRPLKIACFHGGGSNRRIFAAQCERLQTWLRNEFELVFFDAPFERTAGPGVLPYFQSYAPFKSWFTTDELGQPILDGSGYDDACSNGIERALAMMAQKAPRSQWVGVMGFSQGTRVAAGLLLDQQCREEMGMSIRTNFRFGILCMGSAAPMLSATSRHTFPASETGIMECKINIPTLHMHGLKDSQLLPGRKQLATYFEPATTLRLEIDYHHAMPWHRRDTMMLVESILQIYKDSKQNVVYIKPGGNYDSTCRVTPEPLFDSPKTRNTCDSNTKHVGQTVEVREISEEELALHGCDAS